MRYPENLKLPVTVIILVTLSLTMNTCKVGEQQHLTINKGEKEGLVRYKDKIFKESEIKQTEKDKVYSPGIFRVNPATGIEQELDLDVYEPDQSLDPEMHRPLIIWIHGGGFVKGNKTDQINKDGKQLAFTTRGYVFASINYRLGRKENQGSTMRSAVADAQAAIRYFRANAAKYRIDPNLIITGGNSAGGITSMLLGISSQNAEEFGKLENNQANPGHPSWVTACISIAGAIYPPFNDLIGPDDTPTYIDLHGDQDKVVDYQLAVTTIQTLNAIEGFDARLISFPGIGHPVSQQPDQEGIIKEHIIPVLFDRVISGDICPPGNMGVPRITW